MVNPISEKRITDVNEYIFFSGLFEKRVYCNCYVLHALPHEFALQVFWMPSERREERRYGNHYTFGIGFFFSKIKCTVQTFRNEFRSRAYHNIFINLKRDALFLSPLMYGLCYEFFFKSIFPLVFFVMNVSRHNESENQFSTRLCTLRVSLLYVVHSRPLIRVFI